MALEAFLRYAWIPRMRCQMRLLLWGTMLLHSCSAVKNLYLTVPLRVAVFVLPVLPMLASLLKIQYGIKQTPVQNCCIHSCRLSSCTLTQASFYPLLFPQIILQGRAVMLDFFVPWGGGKVSEADLWCLQLHVMLHHKRWTGMLLHHICNVSQFCSFFLSLLSHKQWNNAWTLQEEEGLRPTTVLFWSLHYFLAYFRFFLFSLSFNDAFGSKNVSYQWRVSPGYIRSLVKFFPQSRLSGVCNISLEKGLGKKSLAVLNHWFCHTTLKL